MSYDFTVVLKTLPVSFLSSMKPEPRVVVYFNSEYFFGVISIVEFQLMLGSFIGAYSSVLSVHKGYETVPVNAMNLKDFKTISV
jgi:hypothetical protein